VSLRSLLGGELHGAVTRRISNDAPVPYVGKYRQALAGLGLSAGPGDRTEELEQYGANGTLFGVVSTLATATSLVNWRLWRKAPSGKDEDRVEVTNPRESAPLMIWEKPNPFFSRQELVESTQQHVDLTGEGWWVVVRMAGVPVEIWPVRPDRMTPVPSVKDFVAGYVYTSPDGESVPLLREDVIMIRWPSPLDIYRGQGPQPALAGDLGGEEAQRAWSESFFRNSALPGGVIKLDVKLSDDEFEELVNRWNAAHRGISNAGRVAVLEQGDFVPLAYNQRDMQFVETRGLTKQAILDAYGFPKFGIGDVQDVNRASADASRAYIAEAKTVPRLERIKGALNNDFLPMFGQDMPNRYEFDYDNPVPPDKETENATLTARTNAWAMLVRAGADPEDAAAVVGLPVMGFDRSALQGSGLNG
jgi:HK97 family phage portal protein